MNEPGTNRLESNQPPPKPTSRRPLIVLFLMFAVPLAIAFILYYGGLWRPATSTEHGNLIHPARPLPEIALATASGELGSPKFLQEKWSLVFIGNGRCLERCRAALADIQRAREMLGKDIMRVQPVLLATADCCDTGYLNATYPNLVIARVDGENARSLMSIFPVYDEIPVNDAGRIYIVDPLGNLMMSYPADATGIGMYEDLKQLLKLSHIG